MAAVRARYDAARAREAALREKLASLEASAIALRELGARYDLLKNDVETRAALHASLLKQQMETAVNSELAASNVRVIERAEVPSEPSTPNMPLNLVLGLCGGSWSRVGATFACEYFDDSVKSSEEMEGCCSCRRSRPSRISRWRGARRLARSAHRAAREPRQRPAIARALARRRARASSWSCTSRGRRSPRRSAPCAPRCCSRRPARRRR